MPHAAARRSSRGSSRRDLRDPWRGCGYARGRRLTARWPPSTASAGSSPRLAVRRRTRLPHESRPASRGVAGRGRWPVRLRPPGTPAPRLHLTDDVPMDWKLHVPAALLSNLDAEGLERIRLYGLLAGAETTIAGGTQRRGDPPRGRGGSAAGGAAALPRIPAERLADDATGRRVEFDRGDPLRAGRRTPAPGFEARQ